MAAKSEDFVISRVFAAPPALVFAAWTDAGHLGAWWGPHGFKARVELDARAGGAFRIVMTAANGVEYPMNGRFREIVPNERIVYTHDLSEHPDEWHDAIDPKRDRSRPKPSYECETTVTFEPIDDKTRMTVRTRFPSAALRARFVEMGMYDGWGQSLEKLASRLADEPPSADASNREIRTTRIFSAPRPLVWKMWTEAEHIGKWWGPRGFRTTTHAMDVRVGGVWDFVMHGPDGTDYKNKNLYLELDPQERLVYSHVSEPLHHVTVTFTDEGAKTRVDMRMLFDTAKQRDWVENKHRAVEGQQQTLDRLEELLLAR
jgi:uncharacterized protein YndB with AHSA1/START domain